MQAPTSASVRQVKKAARGVLRYVMTLRLTYIHSQGLAGCRYDLNLFAETIRQTALPAYGILYTARERPTKAGSMVPGIPFLLDLLLFIATGGTLIGILLLNSAY